MGGLIAISVFAFFLLVYSILTYNSLVNLRNLIRESWSDVETELKRRHDLIPNLVEAVKGYARHEKQVLESVVDARARAVAGIKQGEGARRLSQQENELTRTLRSLFALAERYPNLKASRNFLQLQRELVNTEDRVQAARRFYNANVRDFNNKVEMFPSSIIARLFGFKRAEFFEIEPLEAEVPRVSAS